MSMLTGYSLQQHAITTAGIVLILACCRLEAGGTASRLDPKTPYRGVAFLASDIGHDTSVDEMVNFVLDCRLNLVVIDFGWITYHWARTDLAAVREAAERLQAKNIQVMVMYRPRALRPSDAPIHYAVDETGQISPSHNRLCFAHEDSAAWAAQWGVRIRSAIPSVHDFILYNLSSSCQCPACRGGGAEKLIAKFLNRCRTDWARPGPPLQIGHVGISDEYVDAVDFFCPFLCVNRDSEAPVDSAGLVSRLVRLRAEHRGKPMIPLLKVCWEEETRNSTEDIVGAVKACDAARTGFILWYYEWIFHSENHRYDPKPIVAAMTRKTRGEHE